MSTATYTVRVPEVPDWVCDLIAEVARATGTDPAAATRLALVEGLLYWQRAYGASSVARRRSSGEGDARGGGPADADADADADGPHPEGEGDDGEG